MARVKRTNQVNNDLLKVKEHELSSIVNSIKIKYSQINKIKNDDQCSSIKGVESGPGVGLLRFDWSRCFLAHCSAIFFHSSTVLDSDELG